MYLLGLFVSAQFDATGDPADLADLDFFPFPDLGTEFDAEKALDAPIDGFMIAAKSPNLAENLDAAKAFMEFWRKGSTQVALRSRTSRASSPPANDADTSTYSDAPEEGRRDHRRRPADHPVPRPRHQLRLRRAERHAGLPADFLTEPGPGPRPPSRRRSRTSGTLLPLSSSRSPST